MPVSGRLLPELPHVHHPAQDHGTERHEVQDDAERGVGCCLYPTGVVGGRHALRAAAHRHAGRHGAGGHEGPPAAGEVLGVVVGKEVGVGGGGEKWVGVIDYYNSRILVAMEDLLL